MFVLFLSQGHFECVLATRKKNTKTVGQRFVNMEWTLTWMRFFAPFANGRIGSPLIGKGAWGCRHPTCHGSYFRTKLTLKTHLTGSSSKLYYKIVWHLSSLVETGQNWDKKSVCVPCLKDGNRLNIPIKEVLTPSWWSGACFSKPGSF